MRVKSVDGKYFTVGCDCADKVGMNVNLVRKAVRDEAAQKREAERIAAWQAKAKAREDARREAEAKELQAQRDRNGGLTDDEVREDKAARDHKWLIDALGTVGYRSEFIAAMRRDLAKFPISQFRGRTLNILRDIYAKLKGRRNSKAYKQAELQFDVLVAAEQAKELEGV